MSKPLVFVSHSAKDQHAKEVLAALSNALQENGFEVLLVPILQPAVPVLLGGMPYEA